MGYSVAALAERREALEFVDISSVEKVCVRHRRLPPAPPPIALARRIVLPCRLPYCACLGWHQLIMHHRLGAQPAVRPAGQPVPAIPPTPAPPAAGANRPSLPPSALPLCSWRWSSPRCGCSSAPSSSSRWAGVYQQWGCARRHNPLQSAHAACADRHTRSPLLPTRRRAQMQSGFALLEAGSVRAKNTKNILWVARVARCTPANKRGRLPTCGARPLLSCLLLSSLIDRSSSSPSAGSRTRWTRAWPPCAGGRWARRLRTASAARTRSSVSERVA